MCVGNFGNLMVTHYKFIMPSTVSVYIYILYTNYLVTKLLYKTVPMRYYKIKKNKISLYNVLNRGNFSNLVISAFFTYRQSNLQSYQWVTLPIFGGN